MSMGDGGQISRQPGPRPLPGILVRGREFEVGGSEWT